MKKYEQQISGVEVEFKGISYDSDIDVQTYIYDYEYGADRDGNRGEWRRDIEIGVKKVIIISEDDVVRQIDINDIDNFDYVMDELKEKVKELID